MDKTLTKVKEIIEDKLGLDIVVLDFRENNPFVDYFVIASARNEMNALAIINELEDKLSGEYEVKNKDCVKDSGWFLLEVDNCLVHIFYDGKREYYGLEELWKDLRV